MTGPRDRQAPRRLWVTVPLYAVLLAVVAADVWGAIFWASVGGTLGLSVAAGAVVVILLLSGLLLTDARRQWRRHRWTARATAEREAPPSGPLQEAAPETAQVQTERAAMYRP